MSQHTPGPWNFTYLSGGMVGVAAKGRGLIVNVTASREAIVGGMTAEEEEANARLIAKAPEMAEKLEEAAAVLDILANDVSDAGNSEQAEMATERAIHYRALLREIEDRR